MKNISVDSFTNEQGVAMVEMAIISIVFFGMLGAIFDFGLAMKNYNLLTFTVTTTAREIALDVDACSGDLALINKAVTAAATRLTDLGVPVTAAQFSQTRILPISTLVPSRKELQLQGDLPLQCFLCTALPNNIIVSVTGNALIEKCMTRPGP